MAKSNKSERTDNSKGGQAANKSFNLISGNDFNKVVLPWSIQNNEMQRGP